MTTARLFKLGNAQAVRIPARYRFDVDEVEVFQRGDDLVLRPKPRDAAEFFARIRAKHGPIDIQPPARGPAEPIEPLELLSMAAGYLLDTNILSAIMRGEPRALLNKLAGIATERLHLSALVLGELATGAEKGTRKVDTLARLRELGEGMTLIPFDGEDAMTYGRIRAALERKGEMPGQLDCLIAAQAVARGLVLVTDNLREFQRVPGLHCENWLRAPKPTKESSKSR